MICAELRAGKGSYIDFVVKIPETGNYFIGAKCSASGSCSVLVDDVVNDSAQADTGYPMKKIGTIEPTGNEHKNLSFSDFTFDSPGLKLIRFMSDRPKQQLQVDRIQLRKTDPDTK